MTGPAIALAAAVVLIWALALLAGTLGTLDLSGEEPEDSDGEV